MPGQRAASLQVGPSQARRCECPNPLCLADDEGVCCRCGHLYRPVVAASTRRLAEAMLRRAGRQ